MTDIIQTIEQSAVKAWDVFLADLKWVGKEFTIGVAELEKLDPGLQQQVQVLLSAGEVAAQAAAGTATGGMANIIAAGFDSIEQLAANAFQKATNNNPAAQKLSAATVATLQQVSSSLQAAVPVAVAKLLTTSANALAAGAESVAQPPTPQPPAAPPA